MRLWVRVVAVVVGLTCTSAARAAGEEKLARELAALLVAGRSVVAKNQPLVNDASKGHKGFTPDVFAAATAAEFRAATGVDLAALDPRKPDHARLLALFQAAKEVVAEAQPLIDEPGVGFKGFTPAVFGLATGQRFGAATGLGLKQTSDKYRNPKNRPDGFERQVLASFARADWERGKGVAETVDQDGKKVLRYMQPLYVAKACLPCHGDPRGELDVAGRVKEGYREGELRGAVSLTIPLGK